MPDQSSKCQGRQRHAGSTAAETYARGGLAVHFHGCQGRLVVGETNLGDFCAVFHAVADREPASLSADQILGMDCLARSISSRSVITPPRLDAPAT
jgi:hypothetical protein